MESSLSENSQLNQQLQESLDHGKHEIQSLHNLMSECRTLCGESVTVINTGKQLNENTASSLDKIQQVAERQIVQEREIATLADLTNEISNNSKNLLHTLATNHHESLILQAESKQLNKESVLNIEKNTYFISQLQKELEKLKGVNTDYQEKLTAADNQVQLVTQEQRRFKKLYDRALKEISSKEIAARNARESLRESSEIIKSFHKTLADFQQSQLQSQSIISESQQNKAKSF